MKDNFEYDYWLKLIDAIESYTSTNKALYDYDDVDFILAYERKLYFDIFGNHQYVLQIKSALDTKKTVSVDDVSHGDIFSLMYSGIITRCILKKVVKSFIKNIIFKYVFVINFYLRMKGENKSLNSIRKSSGNYFFVSIHHKFIRFMEPVRERVDGIVIICNDFEKTIQACKEIGCRYIVLDLYGKIKGVPNPAILDLVIYYEMAKTLINDFMPEVVIVPEGVAPMYEVFNLAAKKYPKTKTICIQQGWAPVIHTGLRNMHYDLFLTWGDKFSSIFSKYNPEQKFFPSGAHKLYCNSEKKEKYAISFFDQGVGSIIPVKLAHDFLNFAIFVAEKYPQEHIIIREHPSAPIIDSIKERMLKYENITFMNPGKFDLPEVLSISKIAIAAYSSTIYEAMLYDTIPFSLNLTALPGLSPGLNEYEVGIEVDSIELATKEVERLLSDVGVYDFYIKNISRYKDQYFKEYGDNALNNILAKINEITL